MLRIAVVVGSTRPGRVGRTVADWVLENAQDRSDAQFEMVDLADFALPLLDEPLPPSLGRYRNEHTKAWAEAIGSFDGFVIVTGEYNHSVPGALKNALDFLYREWNNKAVAFVSYGSAGGIRAVEHLRLIAAELQMADVRAQVALPLATDFENYRRFTPSTRASQGLEAVFDQVIAWVGALQPLRAGAGG